MGIKKFLLVPVLAVLVALASFARTRVRLTVEPRGPSALRWGGGSGAPVNLLRESPRTLPFDETVRLSPYVERRWLRHSGEVDASEGGATPPRQKLVLTDLGWNHRYLNGLTFPRSLRSRELLQAFVDHENFDPSFRWSHEMSRGENATFPPDVHYVVWMDVETCGESSYPLSAAPFESNADKRMGRERAFEPNADKQMGREAKMTDQNSCSLRDDGCRENTISSILESPLFLRRPNATSLLYLECSCAGISREYPELSHPSLFVFSYSSTTAQLATASGTGAPLPALKLVTLSHAQREALRTCDEASRPYLYTFRGSMRGQARKDLRDRVHNGNDVIVVPSGAIEASDETYEALLYKAVFSGAPRGHCRFSYRFTEVLSAGAIPVVHADDWVLPLHNLIDWDRCVVRIAEAEANRTVDILKKISAEERCERRRYCYDAYRRYLVNPEANVAGMVDSVEMARSGR